VLGDRKDVFPQRDNDRTTLDAKIFASSGGYSALHDGSSEFTGAGLGMLSHIEANVLTIVQHQPSLERLANSMRWPSMQEIADPDKKGLNAGAEPEREGRKQRRAFCAGWVSSRPLFVQARAET